MKKVAIIENNKIVNIAVAETTSLWPQAVEIPENSMVGIGWDYINGEFVAPELEPVPTIVPTSVTIRQARQALFAAGLLHMVENVIESLDEPFRTSARIDWEYAATVDRDWPLVQALKPVLGLTDEQLDQLFIQAASL